ncbi:hypothetical protein [Leucobacter sp. cx-169]|uniref:hypothetical protein n=1 Tax=Leucobacter sp. cx-169 TaxID=2770549 RepID=UPI00165E2BB7|nr:hypothetical protein [Leucobacter sp. cx-169]MBC9927282.1 hypothetical protein [Leucobacter sp. cx-169]
MSTQRQAAGAVKAGEQIGGQWAPQNRPEVSAPPITSGDDMPGAVELIQYRSEIDGAVVIEVDTIEGTGRVRVNINDCAVYDDDPEAPEDKSPFGHLENMTQTERLAAIQGAMLAHLKQYPDDGYAMYAVGKNVAREAQHLYPELIVSPERTTDDEGWVAPQIINPRSGAEDTVICVHTSEAKTGLEEDEGFDFDTEQFSFNYGSPEDSHDLVYIMESDSLPVRLPAGWTSN